MDTLLFYVELHKAIVNYCKIKRKSGFTILTWAIYEFENNFNKLHSLKCQEKVVSLFYKLFILVCSFFV